MKDRCKYSRSIFSEKGGLILAGIGFLFIIGGAFVFIKFGNWTFSNIINEEKIGQYGDFIGGVVGSIFALSGVILYYVALKEQRKDIGINQKALNLQVEALNQQVVEFRAQKAELEETRKVYEEQTTLYREQTELYRQQVKLYKEQSQIASTHQFDSSFYALLNVYISLIDKLNKRSLKSDFFAELLSTIKETPFSDKIPIHLAHTEVKQRFNLIFEINNAELSRCFRTIYRILRLIETSSISDDLKNQYSKILRSQIANNELLLLYYNYHSTTGIKARSLVKRYNLLKHLNSINKIEIGHREFVFGKEQQVSSYIKKITGIIKSNILKFEDIETPDNISISESIPFMGIESVFSIDIQDDNIETRISFSKDLWDKQSYISEDNMKLLISGCLYDILFFSEFKSSKGDEVKSSIEKSDERHDFKFKINNNSGI